MKPVCDYDCFHCPYEDCINDEMRLEDYQEGKKLELISGAKEYNTSESHRAAQKKYYEKNKEKVAAHRKKYYEENKEKVAAYSKKYREENKEKVAAHRKKYREENKEKVAAYNKKYYEENKEKWKEYNQKSGQKESSLALARSVGGKE